MFPVPFQRQDSQAPQPQVHAAHPRGGDVSPGRRRRRRRPWPAEEPAAPAGRWHRLRLSACPLAALRTRGPRAPLSPTPVLQVLGAGRSSPPREAACCRRSQGAVLDPAETVFFLRASLRLQTGARAGPRAAGGGAPTTRLASGLEARGADVRRARIDWRASWGNEVPSANTARSSQQTLFSHLLRPQLELTQATFGWKAGHPVVPGPPALPGRTGCTVTEQLLAERFSSDRRLLMTLL